MINAYGACTCGFVGDLEIHTHEEVIVRDYCKGADNDLFRALVMQGAKPDKIVPWAYAKSDTAQLYQGPCLHGKIGCIDCHGGTVPQPQTADFAILPRCPKCLGKTKEVDMITSKITVCPRCDFPGKDSTAKVSAAPAAESPLNGTPVQSTEDWMEGIVKELEDGMKLHAKAFNFSTASFLENAVIYLQDAIYNYNKYRAKPEQQKEEQ